MRPPIVEMLRIPELDVKKIVLLCFLMVADIMNKMTKKFVSFVCAYEFYYVYNCNPWTVTTLSSLCANAYISGVIVIFYVLCSQV